MEKNRSPADCVDRADKLFRVMNGRRIINIVGVDGVPISVGSVKAV
jgi:hypothetical protein